MYTYYIPIIYLLYIDQSCIYSLKFYDLDQCNPNPNNNTNTNNTNTNSNNNNSTELSPGISTEPLYTIQTAHYGYIYDLEWSDSDEYLLSVGGDGQGMFNVIDVCIYCV